MLDYFPFFFLNVVTFLIKLAVWNLWKALALLRWYSGKESACQCRRHRFRPWVRKILWRRAWQPTPVFLPGESMDRGAWQATVHGVTKVIPLILQTIEFT